MWQVAERCIAIIFTVLCLIGIVSFLVRPAPAHDHYTGLRDPVSKADCCNDRDCFPVANADVRLVANGYVVKTATTESGELFVPFERVIWSQDGQFHKCEWNGMVRCFLAPPLGS